MCRGSRGRDQDPIKGKIKAEGVYCVLMLDGRRAHMASQAMGRHPESLQDGSIALAQDGAS